ncbi:MAG: hypothetical protein HYV07_30245 [Deltaproteobacteria bacterium]|nr:hypothetical protein [Deltaproteobacteria bacterium]
MTRFAVAFLSGLYLASSCADVRRPATTHTPARDAGIMLDTAFADASSIDASDAHDAQVLVDSGEALALGCEPSSGTPAARTVSDLGVGGMVTCVVYADGRAACVGVNTEGQLGDGVAGHQSCPSASDCSLSAVRVATLERASAIDVGSSSCAIEDGAVRCWGLGAQGELGDGVANHERCGSFECSRTPVLVSGISNAREIEVSDYGHSCALLESGEVVCWGSNADSQLGDGRDQHEACEWANGTECSRTPVKVSGLSDAIELSVGGFHSCARRARGGVVCWGHNVFGQLGDGTRQDRNLPVEVPGLSDAVEVEAGYSHTCARRVSGEVVCWGWNSYAQLGRPPAGTGCDGYPCETAPVTVNGLSDVIDLSSRHTHTCALGRSGRVSCWGDGQQGELGDGEAAHETCGSTDCSPTPVQVLGLDDVVEVRAAAFSTCARRRSCEVWCWGMNHGHLGDGTTEQRRAPVKATAF